MSDELPPQTPTGYSQPNTTTNTIPALLMLDIDGVLSPFTKEFSGHAGDPIKFISMVCLGYLNEWLDQHQPFSENIVLSSSWRNNPGFDVTVDALTKAGLRGKVVGATPYWETLRAPTGWGSSYETRECSRPEAIWKYLDNLQTKPDHLLVLDDIIEMTPLGRYHLATSPYAGLKHKQLQRMTELSKVPYVHNPNPKKFGDRT